MITIIDYGLGNILAFRNLYERSNIPVSIARTPAELEKSKIIILPGVGAFDHAMERLNASGMRPILEDLVCRRKIPVLGICVGMQMMAESSEEGDMPGLGWIPGRVRRFDASQLALPHMGWNDARPVKASRLFATIEEDARFYFLHSYYFECSSEADILALADYGGSFSCAVQHDHICGVQFHPEKSHHWGTQLLKNFAQS